MLLQPYRDTGSDKLFDLHNDERVARPSMFDFAVPRVGETWKKHLEVWNNYVLHLIVEVKPESTEGWAREGADDDRLVRHLMLQTPTKENRDSKFGIALAPKWWGKGSGTEVVEWFVNYAFE